MTTLEQRLDRIEAKAGIVALLHSYCRSADLLDPPGMMRHFVDDCQISYVVGEPPMVGKDVVLAMLNEYLPNTTSSQHMITNHEFVFVSDHEVILHTYMYSWQRYKEHPLRSDTHRFGRYECRVILTPQGWRFTHMNLISAGELGETRISEQFARPWPPRFDGVA